MEVSSPPLSPRDRLTDGISAEKDMSTSLSLRPGIGEPRALGCCAAEGVGGGEWENDILEAAFTQATRTRSSSALVLASES